MFRWRSSPENNSRPARFQQTYEPGVRRGEFDYRRFQRGFQTMSKRGGARPGAGRKPSLITRLKQRKLEACEAEAEKSMDLLIRFRDDPHRPDEIRKECAVEIIDRVWGKAKSRVEASGPNGAPFESTNRNPLLDKVIAAMSEDQVLKLALAHVGAQ